ncbi:MAG TPA: transcription-repair coupling factor [Thermoanaerobaculales bacterium]|nr:transcription-repair coupling factor [Thermoanaerobaculales bacterium]HQN95979.1 transcription-repair coupling factor [Thermoanaerobaculales bacterium]
MSYPLPELGELAGALSSGRRPLAIGGVTPGARALVLAALARRGLASRRSLVVVPHVAEAADLAAGLRLLAPELAVGVVPAEVASPYRGTEPPLAARLELVRLLLELAAGEVAVVVAPARALLSPIPLPGRLAERTIRLRRGDAVDTAGLAARLASAGYRRVDLVEEAGEFAVRGFVLDVHAGDDSALRIELDDVAIERIQAFDPATQRSFGRALDAIDVAPLDPFPAGPEQLAAAAAAVDGEHPALAGMMLEGAERRLWWGALHLAGPWTTWLEVAEAVLLCDRDESLGELGRWRKVQEREWRAMVDRDVGVPEPERLLADPELVRQRLEAAELRIETLEVADGSTTWWRLATHPMESFVRRIPDLVPTLRHRRALDLAQVLVVASEGEVKRFRNLLVDGEVAPVEPPPGPGDVAIALADLERGFRWDGGLAVYGRRDLTAAPSPRRRRTGVAAFVSDLRDLRPGDLVVHMDHGIGRFTGFRRIEVEGRLHEMMVLAYRDDDTLLLPVERADLIHKYSSGEGEGAPALDRLGGSTWRRRRSRVKQAVREMAAEMLRLAAARRASRGHEFSPDSPWQREFEDAFAYELTPDQERAVEEIKADMESALPMDRLLCGDVGYGKTEVAIRAAFKAVLDGKQVAVLAPTTILAEQHLDTFRQRFEGFPVETRMLSRFTSPQEAKETLQRLGEGQIDLVIGTHRLLSSDVSFRDLGLVILDEEQRFGVAQKERLKRLRTEVDVVAMSATPIPRTLNMSLTGLRDISLIETPPRDRQAVETSVLEFSEEVVREAVLYEMERGGQVFFVHNRVRSIGAFADWLRRAVPEARVVVAHGQMAERALERAMRAFLGGEADVLLATSIIENGLDIANANTLLVNRADRFGLAQLYQLRGRVGRSERLAFAYFLVPPGQALSPTARARLAAIQEFCELGAGFRIAARDLEIRGAGNLLGAEQHGFMEAVGFETYCRLLEEAVAELEGRELPSRREVELRLGLELQLPPSYIGEPSLRLSFYKRLAAVTDDGALAGLLDEVVDRYGPPPQELANLLAAQRLRTAAQQAGVAAVVRRGGEWRVRLDPAAPAPAELAAVVGRRVGSRVTPAGEILLPASADESLQGVQSLLEELAAARSGA